MGRVNTMGRRVGLWLVPVALLLLAAFLVFRSGRGSSPALPSPPPATSSSVVTEMVNPDAASVRAPIVEPSPLIVVDEENPAEALTTLRGRVIDHETERPIAGARIACVPRWKDRPQPDVLTVTGPDGRFQLEAPCDGGRALRVEADGYPVYWDPSLQLPSREMIYRASGSLDLGEIVSTHGPPERIRRS